MKIGNKSQGKELGNAQGHAVGMWVGLLLLLAVAVFLSLLLGSTQASIGAAVRAAGVGDWENTDLRIFLYVRFPRTLGGVLCGSGLAVAGAVLQVVLNNSLAGPNVIGVNAGAGLATLLVMALFPAWAAFLPLAAFLGALACTLLIYGVARGTGVSRMTIVLAGLAISSILNAASSCVKILFPDVLAAYNSFSVGTLNGITMRELGAAVPYLVFGLTAATLLSGDMNVLGLGEEIAQSLGLNVERCRMKLIVTAAVLAGACVSFAGLIGFVGLLIPHGVRLIFGADNRRVVPASGLLGASTVLLCDLVGRVMFAPFEIHVGIVLSLLGGCGFVLLLLRWRGGRRGD